MQDRGPRLVLAKLVVDLFYAVLDLSIRLRWAPDQRPSGDSQKARTLRTRGAGL
jgi:hypothetical protein